MPQQYETVLLIHTAVDTAKQKEKLDFFKNIVKENDGNLIEERCWGKLNLSYPIQKETQATYYLLHFEGVANTVS